MTRYFLLALLGLLSCAAQAQAFRCSDGAGRTVYTDKPCVGGAMVVAPPSKAELAQQAGRAAELQQRTEALRVVNQELERERLARESAVADAGRQHAPALPAEALECRAARDEAMQWAQDGRTPLEVPRTARANAALACGQAPAEEPVLAWRRQLHPSVWKWGSMPHLHGPAPQGVPSWKPGISSGVVQPRPYLHPAPVSGFMKPLALQPWFIRASLRHDLPGGDAGD